MKRKPFILADLLIPLIVTGLGCAAYLIEARGGYVDFLQRLEWITYDWRVRQASLYPATVPPNLGAVYIDDDSIRIMNEEEHFVWPWPRHLFGKVVRELKAQGAKAVGFDILFSELQAERMLRETNGEQIPIDQFFAREMRQAGNVVLAVLGEFNPQGQFKALPPHPLFQTNAQLGHIVVSFDRDGVVRESFPFLDDPRLGRIWHLGFVLAAWELGLDLREAIVSRNEIRLMKNGGVVRRIPLHGGKFSIDWSLAWNDPKVTQESIENILIDANNREFGQAEGQPMPREKAWKDKLVVVGTIASGNNVSDIGNTPLSRATYLVAEHHNVVSSIVAGRFVRYSPTALSLLLIVLLGAFATLASWQPRMATASLAVALIGSAYLYFAVKLYVYARYCFPLIIPLGTLGAGYLSTVSYRVIQEQKERLRVVNIFSRIVAPEIVDELLQAENLKLGGHFLGMTIYFADVRDFTQMTDRMQSAVRGQAAASLEAVPEGEGRALASRRAQEVLETVNLYLGTIADIVKKHHGTLDKYIGDCVMAFWGAPTHNPNHAVDCVRAAVETQRAIARLNKERAAENTRRAAENEKRVAQNTPPLEMLPILSVGTGINTGEVIVGLMGSGAHILNYTVFGREVNIASRLETVSGRGRIIISESTYRELASKAPDLAAKCILLPKVTVKGIREEIQIYQVAWEKETAIGPMPG